MTSLSSTSPMASSSPTDRGHRLSRIARRSGVAANLITGTTLSRVINTEQAATSAQGESTKEQVSIPRKPSRKSSKWSTLNREIVSTSALMTVSAKIQHIIKLLKQPPEDRTETHVKMLYQWLMNQEKLDTLFSTMSEDSAKKLCKEMEFLHLNSGEVVVHQGEKGSTCFILISGLVSVYVRNPDDQIRHQRLIRSASSLRRLSATASINYGTKVATLAPGATFGELCLIEPDSKRSATVIVDAQAQMANFIVLTAASYLRMTRSQIVVGSITENIAFLQRLLLFKNWTKMQIMHIVNSMKLVNVAAGQFLTRKGADADSFFVFLRGEAVESVNLMVNDNSELTMGENRHVQRSITVELTFLGKFDVAGEYLASEKKVSMCPVDIRATTDVACLVLTRKLFMMHFGTKELKSHVELARKRLRAMAEAREAWRETRILQALEYPHLRVSITRKLMRLSGNCCMICGRCSHVAGDQLCMELSLYHMLDVRQKKQEPNERDRATSSHRSTIRSSISPPEKVLSIPTQTTLPSLTEQICELQSTPRLGKQLVTRQWQETEKHRAIALAQRLMAIDDIGEREVSTDIVTRARSRSPTASTRLRHLSGSFSARI